MHRALLIVAAALSARAAEPQQIPVLTVCEVLAGLTQYDGRTIVVVGRLTSTTEGAWLDESCEPKILIEGYAWANMISLTYSRGSAGTPPKRTNGFKWDKPKLKAKLRQVQKTTTLQVLKKYNYRDKWFAIVGRFETRVPLTVGLGGDGKPRGYGFGHLNAAPAQLIAGDDGYRELKPD